ncbi:linker histone H1M [Sphaeramia orbicularis]|uniref:linker histone H1M n=1 Tax=Sphaeramia orbicularis TaxID=375764 RepID=UPI001180E556|nr:protein B4-like [Sphaeramia orbicularis]
MPPKKAAAVAAASADPSPAEASPEQKEKTKTDAAKLRKIADHPSVRNMVMEALKVLDSRKGVSNQAIQNYIKQKWLMDPVRLKHFVRKELTKGLENGSYVRPPGSTVTTGVMGKFRLASKIKKAKPKSENVDPNVQKASKVAKDGAKKLKKTGDNKKDAASKEDKSKDPKPSKKAKKAEEASSSKVAPAKKPKAKKAVPKEGEGASNAAKPKAKATKVTKEKAAKADCDAPASKAPGKRGKKTAE